MHPELILVVMENNTTNTTIFAQSSVRGKSGVAVFRVSGKNALNALTEFGISKDIKPNFTYLRDLKSKTYNCTIDKALVIYFKSPNSFTGEDVIEFHTHGSIAIAKMLTEELLSIKDFRIAEPGEFSKRAFLNSKIDLTSAEGLADLIESETILQHNQAMRQFSGELHNIYQKWRQSILEIISLIEAFIDFPDEEIPRQVLDEVKNKIEELKVSISNAINDNRRGERLRDGISVVIIGEPNVGKSSLINLITQRDVSIVSDISGTTRDVIESYIDIGGYPIILSDTAGIKASTYDKIEKEGIRKAVEKAKTADIKLFVLDASKILSNFNYKLDKDLFSDFMDQNVVFALNKIDLITDNELAQVKNLLSKMTKTEILNISVEKNIGIDLLLKNIELVAENILTPKEMPAITRIRHRKQLTLSLEAIESCDVENDLVLAAEDMRIASRQMSMLIGKIDVDEILGEIFGKFCIGK